MKDLSKDDNNDGGGEMDVRMDGSQATNDWQIFEVQLDSKLEFLLSNRKRKKKKQKTILIVTNCTTTAFSIVKLIQNDI